MADFTWVPDQQMGESVELDCDEVKFGDGYRQIVVRSINPVVRDFSPSFTVRPRTEVTAIDSFLRAKAGQPFTFDHPDGVVVKVTCKKWSRSFSHDLDCSLSASFEIWNGV